MNFEIPLRNFKTLVLILHECCPASCSFCLNYFFFDDCFRIPPSEPLLDDIFSIRFVLTLVHCLVHCYSAYRAVLQCIVAVYCWVVIHSPRSIRKTP
jgi:hypothetical protein